MPAIKVIVEAQDRKTLLELVKAERRNVRIESKNPVTTAAQRRAVEFYQDHLFKLHKRLDPNDKFVSKYI